MAIRLSERTRPGERGHSWTGSGYSDGRAARLQSMRAEAVSPQVDEDETAESPDENDAPFTVESAADEVRKSVAAVVTALHDTLRSDPRVAVAGLRRVSHLAEQQVGHPGTVLPFPVGVDQLLSVVPGLATTSDSWEALADYAETLVRRTWGTPLS